MSIVKENNPDFDLALPKGVAFLTIRQLAVSLGVSRQHVMNLIEKGDLEAGADVSVTGSTRSSLRIPRASVIRFLNSRRVIVEG
jgi:excisionase family DNA binding protein